ncbi:MAG: Na(+)/H(+) antiporter subunit B [Eubacteriales bacterium]
MKQIVSILLVAAIGFFVFSALYFSDESLRFNEYGNGNIEDRVSEKYVSKSVNGDNGEVIFDKSLDLESGSANMVTSVVVNYRSFDTLGEVTVLFISAFGVGLLLSGSRKRSKLEHKPSFILKQGSRIVFGIMVVFGVYVFVHGHITPGGGFPGGAIIAAAILLLYLSDDEFRIKMSAAKAAEGVAGSLYVIIGLLGIVLAGYFLQNFLPTGTVGEVISSGIIPVVYMLIGLKVGSELSSVVDSFLTEEVEG